MTGKETYYEPTKLEIDKPPKMSTWKVSDVAIKDLALYLNAREADGYDVKYIFQQKEAEAKNRFVVIMRRKL